MSVIVNKDVLWTERYRPKTIEETILPERIKKTFQSYVDDELIPNLLLCGGPGVGKTTVAKAMLEQLGCDYIVINGSLNGNIDTLRHEIQQFASSVSLMGGRKYVIIDEADGINPNSFQPALRNFMESFSNNCGFILTCNFANKIIEPLHSRCAVVDFKISKTEMGDLAKQFMIRSMEILDKENIEYDKKVLATLIKKHYPDWRRIINQLQTYSVGKVIDSGILAEVQDVPIKELIDYMKDKNFTEVRKWAATNNFDSTEVFRKVYDQGSKLFTPDTLPLVVLIIGKYQYQHSFCADPEINLVCCLTEIMIEAAWR